jgi:uncharacterized membrane protein YsdA (DUF1294 family)
MVDHLHLFISADIARHKLRHKTIKQPFRFIFWCTVVLNCLGLGFA